MNTDHLRNLLEQIAKGTVSVSAAIEELKFLPYADLGMAKIDHHRELRSGTAEAVFGPGKRPDDVAEICRELDERTSGAVLVTKASPEQFEAVRRTIPNAVFYEDASLIVVRKGDSAPGGVVGVISAGTADQPVAEEAALVADAFGLKVERLRDVGVAGLHRLLSNRDVFERADVLIVVAGMDGVLPGIVAGLVSAPVIAVPTSVGYGAGSGGIAPLLTMLNACAPGVAVVNIDNGFGAAVFAAAILRPRGE